MALRTVQEDFLRKINLMESCELIETKEAKGIPEKYPDKIKEIEAQGLEKHLRDDYIICLFDKGREMKSEQFARLLEKTSLDYPHSLTFVVGGFLGLADRIIQRANYLLSLSRMTFSHELTRVVLLEQVYRSLTILKGRQYAK